MKTHHVLFLALACLSVHVQGSASQAVESSGPSFILRVGSGEKGRATCFTMAKNGSGLNAKGRMQVEGGRITVEKPIELTIGPGLRGLTLRTLAGCPALLVEVDHGRGGRISEAGEYRGSTFIMRREAESGKPTFAVQ